MAGGRLTRTILNCNQADRWKLPADMATVRETPMVWEYSVPCARVTISPFFHHRYRGRNICTRIVGTAKTKHPTY